MSGEHAAAAEDVQRSHLVALVGLPDMGPARLRLLLDGRDPVDAWEGLRRGRIPMALSSRLGRRREEVVARWTATVAGTVVAERWAEVAASGQSVSWYGAPGYPAALLDDPEPPVVLFATGGSVAEGAADRPRVAIVGTRRCTAYGRSVAVELGRSLAAAGVEVVSGLAIGIDAAAHLGALRATDGAPPIAVVGTGLDVVYPSANRDLWERVAEHGRILSEMPPGSGPTRWCFPARNRIVAGLADVLVVVESHAEGGSLHTVAAALDRDRPVLAVPGPIRSPASAGCNRLLAEGAAPACGPDDVLGVLSLLGRPASPVLSAGEAPEPADLGTDARRVLDALGWDPVVPDALAARTGLPPVALIAAVAELTDRGLVVETRGHLERRGEERS